MATSILIVDDDASVRRVLREVLEREGYTVREAANGKIALREFRRVPADLLITDIFMPEQEGVFTIGAMRREFPDLKIVAISGAAGEYHLEVARLMGAQAALHKPFHAGELTETIRGLLGHR